MTTRGTRRPARLLVAVAAVAVGALAVLAWSRVGMLNLPAAPRSVTLESAGLNDLQRMNERDRCVRAPLAQRGSSGAATTCKLDGAAESVRAGIVMIVDGREEAGLDAIRAGLRAAPRDLVLANAYRMMVFRSQRQFLQQAARAGSLTPLPTHLNNEPIALLEELDVQEKSRETRLSLALAWVDHMLLFPALEIKAPSSVEAVDLLSDLIDHGHEAYVPALFARGLNHLHRPARLVWPESAKTPRDAAAQDIGRCVAIGRKLGAGSARLQATLAMTLGDAYLKAGEPSVARSWWQIAQNLARSDASLQEAVRRRYGWNDEEILDRLEEELDRGRSQLDRPMTDLALMWDE